MLLIKNGLIIDPARGLRARLDLLVRGERVAALGQELAAAEEAEIIDASGMIVCPGFIDMHTHLREPGQEHKEVIASGTRAAAAGGFTSVCCMPNTEPVVDNAALVAYVRRQAEETGVVNVFPIGAVSKRQAGAELAEIGAMAAAGCVAVSDDGHPVENARLMRSALAYAGMLGLPVLSHCEEKSLSAGGQMHEGAYSTRYGLAGIPSSSEAVMAARDIILAEETGTHVHICHVSSRETAALIRAAKARGVQVTAEVTPHHLVLSDEDVKDFDAFYKVNPPLRGESDRKALVAALAEGVIDCVATDHAPHHAESKECEFDLASSGISGLETAVPLLMHHLVGPGQLSLDAMVERLTAAPARVLNLERGTLAEGAMADITIIAPKAEKAVRREMFYSKGKNTPFDGRRLSGWPWLTVVSGRVVAKDGVVL
jgi:dihydroorotase